MHRNASIDILKLILSFFVVGLHLLFFDDINRNIGFFLNQGVFRLAVPIFLVINGYFFARIETINQYKIWISRILFLYLFWMLAYSPFFFFFNMNSNIVNLLKGYFHLWYIVGIVYCSVLVYVLRSQNLKIIIFLSSFLYILGVILQYSHAYSYIDIPNFSYRNFLFFCMPFFSAGFIIKKLEKNNQELNVNRYLMFASVVFLLEVVFNIFNLNKKFSFDINISFIFLCPLLFYKISKVNIIIPVKNIALIASVIYFVHPLVFTTIKHFWKFGSISLTVLTIIISVLFSFPLIKLNHKIKIL